MPSKVSSIEAEDTTRGWILPPRSALRFHLRLRQEAAQDEAKDDNDQADAAGGLRHVEGQHRPGVTREERRDTVCRDEGGAGAEHAAAHVGGEAAARAAQVERERLGQVLSEVAELGDRHKAYQRDAPREGRAGLVKQKKVGEWD